MQCAHCKRLCYRYVAIKCNLLEASCKLLLSPGKWRDSINATFMSITKATCPTSLPRGRIHEENKKRSKDDANIKIRYQRLHRIITHLYRKTECITENWCRRLPLRREHRLSHEVLER